MNTFLYWNSFEKDQIPGVLIGGARRSLPIENISHDSSYLVDVAFTTAGPDQIACLLCVDDSDATDFFSWMSVYSPSTFPVSQTKRIIVRSDYELLQKSSRFESFDRLSLKWSSIILGEILAQGDESKDIESIPISRYLACFSTTYGRTVVTYPGEGAAKECIKRLELLENDGRFLARQVSVTEMLPCWTYAVGCGKNTSFEDIAFNFGSDVFVGAKYKEYAALAAIYLPKLMDSSIEQRVVAFNGLVNEISSPFLSDVKSIAALLGVAAFLVGRGTSHISLLRKAAKNYPGAFMWFGALASLTGPSSWDIKWARAVRSIDRFVGDKFDISDASSADLCWAEYFWLALSDAKQSDYMDIPKLYPRLLTVEVLPGVNCQLRLATSMSVRSNETVSKVEVNAAPTPNSRVIPLEHSVDALIHMALKLKADMHNLAFAPELTQQQLFPQEEYVEKPKPSRTSKSKASPRNKKT